MYQTILDLLVTALGAVSGTTLFVTLEVVATIFSLFLVAIPVIVMIWLIGFILRLIRR